jgi:hypothetical protein
MSRLLKALLIILLIMVSLLPLYSGGTGDVSVWQGWIEAIEREGFVSGYIPVYPPLTWTFLQIVAFSYHALNIEMFLALKWSLVFFLFLTSLIFLLRTRNLLLTAFLHISLILSSVALGYLDIWFAPTMLLALFALKERKIFLFSIFYTASFLVKWQPLIIAPFLLVYLVRLIGITHWKTTIKVLLADVILPTSALISAIVFVFREGLLMSLQDAMGHAILSGYALNYNWLLTYYLRLTQPDRFGAIAGGIIDYVDATDWPTVGLSKILFVIFYIVTLIVFARRTKSFDNLLRFSILGYLSYFTFNTGVHENHLFLAGLLVVILYWVNSRDLYTTLIIVLMANINLFVFYGINGGPGYQRLIGGIDITVPLALFNVVFFLVFWTITCWRENPDLKADVWIESKFDRTDNVMTDNAVS